MYTVLIIDDEPLMIAGLKYMLDWGSLNCNIVASIPNNTDAITCLEHTSPDIVITNLGAPCTNGMDIISHASKQIVFIILTNHKEYSLVKQALNYKVTDYLIKKELDEKMLFHSVQEAIIECENRKKLQHISATQNDISIFRDNIIAESLTYLFYNEHEYVAYDSKSALMNLNLLHNYMFISIVCTPIVYDVSISTQKLNWIKELISNILNNFFSEFSVFTTKSIANTLTVFIWNINIDDPIDAIHDIHKKLNDTLIHMTQTQASLLYSNICESDHDVLQISQDYISLSDYFFNTRNQIVSMQDVANKITQPILAQKYYSKILSAIRTKDIVLINELFIELKMDISNKYLSRRHTLLFIKELNTFVIDTLIVVYTSSIAENFKECEDKLSCFQDKNNVIAWLTNFYLEIYKVLSVSSNIKTSPVKIVKDYIAQNLHTHFTLNELSAMVFLSSSYLSTIFTKEEGVTLIDYINKQKVDLACNYLSTENFNISELSAMLSFENSNYFSKVFKKYTGFSPSAYKRIHLIIN